MSLVKKSTFTIPIFIYEFLAHTSVLALRRKISILYPVVGVTINAYAWSTTGLTYRTYLLKTDLFPPNVLSGNIVQSFHENSDFGPIKSEDVKVNFDKPINVDGFYSFEFQNVNKVNYTSAGGTDVVIKLIFECAV